jgi:hypothetical protein
MGVAGGGGREGLGGGPDPGGGARGGVAGLGGKAMEFLDGPMQPGGPGAEEQPGQQMGGDGGEHPFQAGGQHGGGVVRRLAWHVPGWGWGSVHDGS